MWFCLVWVCGFVCGKTIQRKKDFPVWYIQNWFVKNIDAH